MPSQHSGDELRSGGTGGKAKESKPRTKPFPREEEGKKSFMEERVSSSLRKEGGAGGITLDSLLANTGDGQEIYCTINYDSYLKMCFPTQYV